MLVLKRRERVFIQTKSTYLGEGKECLFFAFVAEGVHNQVF